MKIRIHAQDIRVTKALRTHVELRLAFALSKFGEHIGRVAVHLSHSDERRDRKEKRCRITVDLPRCVKVQETDADLFAAIVRAADRAARSVAHMIELDRARAADMPGPAVLKKPRSGATRTPVTRRKRRAA